MVRNRAGKFDLAQALPASRALEQVLRQPRCTDAAKRLSFAEFLRVRRYLTRCAACALLVALLVALFVALLVLNPTH